MSAPLGTRRPRRSRHGRTFRHTGILSAAGLLLGGLPALAVAEAAVAVPADESTRASTTVPAAMSPRTSARAPLNRCASTDNAVPIITGITFDPPAVDVTGSDQRVRVTVRAHDEGGPGAASGIRGIGATLGPGFRDTLLDFERVGAQRYEADVVIPRHARDGDWRFRLLALSDKAGNDPTDDGDLPHALRQVLDGATLPVTTVADEEAPTATEISLSRKRVDTTRKARSVRVVMRAADNDTGIEAASVEARRGDHRVRAKLRDRGDGSFAGNLRVPRWVGTGTWKLSRLELTDRAGNVGIPRTSSLPDLGRTTFAVKSRTDRKRPRLVSITTKPRTVDVRKKSARVKFRARLRDNRSGVHAASVSLAGRTVKLHKVAGTARNGIWQGALRFSSCRSFPKRSVFLVTATDRAGNELETVPNKRVRVRSGDHRLGRASLVEQRNLPVSGPVQVRFAEPVNGIGSVSAVMQQSRWPLDHGAPITGSWSCTTGKGKQTSCHNGNVRVATWTPADGALEAGTDYRLMLNPEGNLGVRDLAGNAYHRYELGWFTR